MAEKKVQNKREEIEVKEVESGGNKYSLPYGIAKGLGLSTEGMTPTEVWNMLSGYGMKPKEEYDKYYEKLEKQAKTEIGKTDNAEKKEISKLTNEEKSNLAKQYLYDKYKGKLPDGALGGQETESTYSGSFDSYYGNDEDGWEGFTEFVNNEVFDSSQEIGENVYEVVSAVEEFDKTESKELNPFNSDAYTPERYNNALNSSDPKAYDKMARVKTYAVWEKLSKESKFAVVDYTGAYSKFNEPLRGIEYGTSKYLGVGKVDLEQIGTNYGGYKKGEIKKRIDDLTSAIEQCSYDEDVVLRRGCNWSGMDKFFEGITENQLRYSSTEELTALMTGKTYKDYGFTSCGSTKNKGFTETPIKFSIYAPKGTKMMYVEPVSKFGDGSKGVDWKGESQSTFGYEDETVIQRGTGYRVTKVERISGGGLYVRMEVVSQEKYN